jgi:hypothetical protein
MKGIKHTSIQDYFLLFFSFAFVFFAVFMPADNLGLKKITFVIVVFFSINLIIQNIIENQYLFLSIMATVFPTFYIAISILMGNNIKSVIQIGYPGYYLLLFLGLKKDSICYTQILIKVLKILSLLLLVCGVAHYLGIMTVENNPLLQYLYTTENAMIGDRINASFGIMIFIKSSPLLFLLFGYSLYKNDLPWAIISSIALFFSGTRADVFGTIILWIIWLLMYNPNKNTFKYIKFLILTLLFILLIIAANQIIIYVVDIIGRRKNNDLIRFSYFQDVFAQMNSMPISYLLGTGFGSEIYVHYGNRYSTIIEISYLDLFRQIGLIGFIVFSSFIVKPLSCSSEYKWLKISYIMYLIAAATNPLLYTSTAYLGYVFMYLITDKKYLGDNYKYKIKIR